MEVISILEYTIQLIALKDFKLETKLILGFSVNFNIHMSFISVQNFVFNGYGVLSKFLLFNVTSKFLNARRYFLLKSFGVRSFIIELVFSLESVFFKFILYLLAFYKY